MGKNKKQNACMKGNLHTGLLILSLIFGAGAFGQQNVKPNVIIILADDMGVGDIGIFNGGLNNTPHIDSLVQRSIWFGKGYSASAVCAPARAALMTGRYPHRTGVTGLDMESFPTMTSLGKNEVTLADVFKHNGYHTGLIGKWHLGDRSEYHPLKRGFDHYVGSFYMDTYFKYKLDINGVNKEYNGPYLTSVLTDSAISFVNNNRRQPFFLYLAYNAPHRPLSAPEDLVKQYRKKGFDLETAQVYAMIEIMDNGIGRLMSELDRLKIRKNTIIVFASDNGPDPIVAKRFNQHLKGSKYTVNEGGIRVPLLFSWDKKFKEGKNNELVHFVDIFPTLTELCKIKVANLLTKKLDGLSFASFLLKGQGSPGLRHLYWQWNRGVPYYTHNAAVREGDWKLVRPFVTRNNIDKESVQPYVLYNLKEDPEESQDLSLKQPALYFKMKSLLEDWSRKVEAERLKTTAYDN